MRSVRKRSRSPARGPRRRASPFQSWSGARPARGTPGRGSARAPLATLVTNGHDVAFPGYSRAGRVRLASSLRTAALLTSPGAGTTATARAPVTATGLTRSAGATSTTGRWRAEQFAGIQLSVLIFV